MDNTLKEEAAKKLWHDVYVQGPPHFHALRPYLGGNDCIVKRSANVILRARRTFNRLANFLYEPGKEKKTNCADGVSGCCTRSPGLATSASQGL